MSISARIGDFHDFSLSSSGKSVRLAVTLIDAIDEAHVVTVTVMQHLSPRVAAQPMLGLSHASPLSQRPHHHELQSLEEVR